MITWYRNHKKRKYELKLQSFLEFNAKRIEQYKSSQNIDNILHNNPALCQNYNQDFLELLNKKYDVNLNLIDNVINSENTALKLYYQKKENESLLEKQEEERKQIDLYKKAILELKQTNKI